MDPAVWLALAGFGLLALSKALSRPRFRQAPADLDLALALADTEAEEP